MMCSVCFRNFMCSLCRFWFGLHACVDVVCVGCPGLSNLCVACECAQLRVLVVGVYVCAHGDLLSEVHLSKLNVADATL